MKTLKYIAVTIAGVCFIALGPQASAVNISPGSEVKTGTATSTEVIRAEITAFVLTNYGCTITEQYKSDAPGTDSGPFAASYTTVFLPPPGNDPSGANITYDGSPDPAITGFEHTFLLVKDGAQTPSYYLFDISTWNGTDPLNLSGFWPQQGAISFVAIYTCPPDGGGAPPPPPPPTDGGGAVPEGGSTLAMLGAAAGGLGFLRRKFKS